LAHIVTLAAACYTSKLFLLKGYSYVWDLRFSQQCCLSFKSPGMCHWMGSSWSVEGLTSYKYTYVTPYISTNLAILGLLDPKGKSTTILQNNGNHLPNDMIMFQKT